MGRHLTLKRPKPTKNAPSADADRADDDDGALVRRAGRVLERLLSATEATLDAGDVTPALMREASGLARAIQALEAERRANKKMLLQHAATIAKQDVLLFARSLSKENRAGLLREIAAMGDRRSVLS